MAQNEDYTWILKQYPDTISKEQFYQIAHISKRTAALLLQHGFVPCLNSGKKTRQYTILTKDVVAYLQNRELHPQMYTLPEGSYVGVLNRKAASQRNIITAAVLGNRAEAFYAALLEPYPDVLSIREVNAVVGYSLKTLHRWCKERLLPHFVINGAYKFPKCMLLEFLLSDRFPGIRFSNDDEEAKLLTLLSSLK